jgi:hypothetical protein
MSRFLVFDHKTKNAERRQRAEIALTAYAAACEFADPETFQLADGADSPEAYLIDLLADLMHWCDQQEFDFVDCFQSAEDHHDLELDDPQGETDE